MEIQRNIDINVELSPEDIADCFCDLRDDEQAVFFNRISEVVKKWGSPFCFQLQHIINNGILTRDGKEIMCQIGEYGGDE